jgi:hypothetical protein
MTRRQATHLGRPYDQLLSPATDPMSRPRSSLLIGVICLAACTEAPERTPPVGTVALQASPTVAPQPSPVAATSPAALDGGTTTGVLPEGDSLAPTIPRTLHDVCEGEDCTTAFRAFACTALTLRADTHDDAPVVAQVPAHDTVRVTHTDWHLTAPGIVLIRRSFLLDWRSDSEGDRAPRPDTVHFAAGDTVRLLHYMSLGSWRWWYRGRISTGGEFWDGDSLNGGSELSDSSIAEIVSRPAHEDWWRIELAPERGGWWHAGRGHERALAARYMGEWDGTCPAGD